MKIVLANWGSRGEIEPCVAIGRELLRRGHEVCVAVAPDMVGFVDSAGVSGVAYGLEFESILDAYRDLWTHFFRTPWRVRLLLGLWRQVSVPLGNSRAGLSATLRSLAEGADALVTGMNFEDIATNVAEACDIPLATLHYFPMRENSYLVSFLPRPLSRLVMRGFWWVSWRGLKSIEDGERRALGLPSSSAPMPRRIGERGSLEIQAYDEVCFPGLAAEWAMWNSHRPFVGALTLELETESDEEVTSWIAAGKPPIFFGFGSIPVKSGADAIAMIAAACARLGERALVGAAGTDFVHVPHYGHVKVVGTMNYGDVFPACRAVVHHGGAGTTAAGLRAGLPALVLWTGPDQQIWGVRVKRLKVGAVRRFSTTTEETLVADLRTILDPAYLIRARQLATRMTKVADSIQTAADLVEHYARNKRVG